MNGKYIGTITDSDNEVSISLSKGDLSKDCIDFIAVVTSSKYTNVDISFEYKLYDVDYWHQDAKIVSSSTSHILNNKIYGLVASSNGSSNIFKWNYSNNTLNYGSSLQVRLSILPRVISYGYNAANNTSIVSQTYGENKADIDIISNKKIIGKDMWGRYICPELSMYGAYNVNLYSNVYNLTPDLSLYYKNPYSSFHPSCVIQRNNVIAGNCYGNYIILDFSSGYIYEMNSTGGDVTYFSLSEYGGIHPVFIDIKEVSNSMANILVSLSDSSVVSYTWPNPPPNPSSVQQPAQLLWQSSNIFNPTCATWGNGHDVIICNQGTKNSVYIYNGISNTYTEINNYKLYSNGKSEETSLLHNPFRAYELEDGRLWICEEDGEEINLENVDLSSHSSEESSGNFPPVEVKLISGTPWDTNILGIYTYNGMYYGYPSYANVNGNGSMIKFSRYYESSTIVRGYNGFPHNPASTDILGEYINPTNPPSAYYNVVEVE